MTVRELTQEQLDELKAAYVTDQAVKRGEFPSYSELAMSTEVPNDIIFDYYDGIHFVEDDFFCGEEEQIC